MRRTVIFIVAVFLLGLMVVVGVSTWQLQTMRASIRAEREGTIALYRIGGRAHHEVQALESAVERLFKASTPGEVAGARTALDTQAAALAQAIAAIQEPRFADMLAKPTAQADGTQGEPLAAQVAVLAAGHDEVRAAVAKVVELAATRLALHERLVSAKNELSKVARRTLDLAAVDAKAYSGLMRGVIAVVSTDSAADLKFVGLKIFEDNHQVLAGAALSGEQKAGLAALQTQFMTTYEVVRQYLSTGSDADFFTRVVDAQLAALALLVRGTEASFDRGQDELETTASATITTTLNMALGVALLCLVLGMLVTRRLTGPLARTMARMSAVSTAIGSGDLTARVEISGKDEVSAMASAINSTLDQLRQAMTRIGTSVQALSSRSGQLGGISRQLDESATTTSAMTNELSATATQVSQSIQSVSAGIEEFSAGANEIARTTGEAAVLGRAAVEQARSAETTMRDLTQASQQIGSIIAVIEGITEQTKLLALNATIEAARAGDAGRGFAVVANEVKVLASKTAHAAGDIRAQVDAIRNGSASVSDAITAVAATIGKVNDFQQSIAGAVEEQAATTRELATHLAHAATGGSEIATGVGEVARGAQSNSDHARTVLTTAHDLAQTTSDLDGFVGRFRY